MGCVSLDHEFFDLQEAYNEAYEHDEVNDYVVDRILADKMVKFQRHYLIQWAPPHDNEEPTWEPNDELIGWPGADEAIALWKPKHDKLSSTGISLTADKKRSPDKPASKDGSPIRKPAAGVDRESSFARQASLRRLQRSGSRMSLEDVPEADESFSNQRTADWDRRKLLDEFKKPLDDTYSLIDDFGLRREVPTILLVAQVEAMREHLNRLVASTARIKGRIDTLEERPKLSSTQQETLSELRHEKRRLDNELAGLRSQTVARREDALIRTLNELLRAETAYRQGFEDQLKAENDREALGRLMVLCEPLLPEKLEEREEERPRQPAEVGEPHHTRTLLRLAERADVTSRLGGPLERLATAAAQHGGPSCYVEMSAVKGFRRALQKAQQDYGGDYLMLNDMARCSIITPRLSTLTDVFDWLLKENGTRPMDESTPLPHFEPLQCKDRLSPSFDAEGMYRYVLLVGRLTCDSGELLNVEIQLHIKRLFELKKTLHTLHEGRRALGADDDEVALHEGEIHVDALKRASRGLIRRIACVNSVEPLAGEARGMLIELLQTSPCTLTYLELSGTQGLEGRELGKGFLMPPHGSHLACHRLRALKLARMGMTGTIPGALAQCMSLEALELQDNALLGAVPSALWQLRKLHTLALHGNGLEGQLEAEGVAAMKMITTLTLGGDAGGNEELFVSRSGSGLIEGALSEAWRLYLPRVVDDEEAVRLAAEAERRASLAEAQATLQRNPLPSHQRLISLSSMAPRRGEADPPPAELSPSHRSKAAGRLEASRRMAQRGTAGRSQTSQRGQTSHRGQASHRSQTSHRSPSHRARGNGKRRSPASRGGGVASAAAGDPAGDPAGALSRSVQEDEPEGIEGLTFLSLSEPASEMWNKVRGGPESAMSIFEAPLRELEEELHEELEEEEVEEEEEEQEEAAWGQATKPDVAVMVTPEAEAAADFVPEESGLPPFGGPSRTAPRRMRRAWPPVAEDCAT